MKLKISKGAQFLGLNLVSIADFKGINDIRAGLKLVNAFEKDLPKPGENFNPAELEKKVEIELDLNMATKLKEIIENQQGMKGANTKYAVELYDAIEASTK